MAQNHTDVILIESKWLSHACNPKQGVPAAEAHFAPVYFQENWSVSEGS